MALQDYLHKNAYDFNLIGLNIKYKFLSHVYPSFIEYDLIKLWPVTWPPKVKILKNFTKFRMLNVKDIDPIITDQEDLIIKDLCETYAYVSEQIEFSSHNNNYYYYNNCIKIIPIIDNRIKDLTNIISILE